MDGGNKERNKECACFLKKTRVLRGPKEKMKAYTENSKLYFIPR
jgi:hypothetical protein